MKKNKKDKTEVEINERKTETVENKKMNDTGVFSEEKSKAENEAFMSEFAPEPIKIPNYDIQKEEEKRTKRKTKQMKSMTESAKKRRRIIKKILLVVRCIIAFVLLSAVMSTTLAIVLVKVNTSEYAIEKTIENSEPEKFIVGKIKNPAALGLKESSEMATIMDILRDNALHVITYEEISREVDKSSYSEFIAKHTHGVISYLLMGKRYNGIAGKDIEKLLDENISHIKLATGVELGETACAQFSKYVDKSSALKELKPSALEKLSAAKYTEITKVAFSLMSLICNLVALLLVVLITAAMCSGYTHIIFGLSCVLSSIIVGGAGLLFDPKLVFKNIFIRNVYNAILDRFNSVSLIAGIVVIIIGLLVLCIGNIASYDEEDDVENVE